MALIWDTGPLYAAMDRRDIDHFRCTELLAGSREEIAVPSPVVVELEWLSSTRLGTRPFDAFLLDVEDGAVRILDLNSSDYSRARELMERYEDLDLGYVDAAVVALAERLGEPKIASLDHRHLGVVRPRHVRALELLPQ